MQARFLVKEGSALKELLEEARNRGLTVPNAVHDMAAQLKAYKQMVERK